MNVRPLSTTILVLSVALNVACAGPSDVPATEEPSADPAGQQAGASEPAANSAAPAGAHVVCHLDCSGNQAEGYGASEEEARADVSQHVDKLCKPEDGQYFIFCETAK